MIDKPPVNVIPTNNFNKRLKKLRKRFHNVNDDVKKLVAQLLRGETPGDQIQGLNATLYKVRLSNRDAKRGKRGGYRVIYYLETQTAVFLIDIYAKTDQDDLNLSDVLRTLEKVKSRLENTDSNPD